MTGLDHYRKAEELTAKTHDYLGQGEGQSAAVWAAVAQITPLSPSPLPPRSGPQLLKGHAWAEVSQAPSSQQAGSSSTPPCRASGSTTTGATSSSALTSVNADPVLLCSQPPSDHGCPCVTVVGRSLSHADPRRASVPSDRGFFVLNCRPSWAPSSCCRGPSYGGVRGRTTGASTCTASLRIRTSSERLF